MTSKIIGQRLQELEDCKAIRQTVVGYGYAMDGCNAHAVGASRIQLAQQADGAWQLVHCQNYRLDGSLQGPAMLARLNEGPAA
jgi:hypothetical protein